jgi:hypothetical protein
MNLDAVGLVRLPEWSDKLKTLFWRLRAARECSRPSPRTWTRRITEEKRRLLELGVPQNELHLVCRILRVSGQPAAQWRAERRYVEFMARKQREGSRWEREDKSRRVPILPPPLM